MWKNLRTLVAILFRHREEHKHGVVVQPDAHNLLKLKKELSTAKHEHFQEVSTLKRANANEALLASQALDKLTMELSESVEHSNLWMKKSAILQDKLSASLGHVKVLENVLVESNRTIDALNLALELREKEENEGLQNYIDELETEMDEAVELINKYGLELRKA